MKKDTVAVIILVVLAACGIGGWDFYEAKIQKMQDAGIAALNASVDLDDYREAEQTEVQAILEESTNRIRAAKEQSVIDSICSDAASEISGIKTDAQYKEEEEAARKAELERKRKEEEARRAEEEAAAAAAAAAQAKKSAKKKSSGSKGCVGGGSDAFY